MYRVNGRHAGDSLTKVRNYLETNAYPGIHTVTHNGKRYGRFTVCMHVLTDSGGAVTRTFMRARRTKFRDYFKQPIVKKKDDKVW